MIPASFRILFRHIDDLSVHLCELLSRVVEAAKTDVDTSDLFEEVIVRPGEGARFLSADLLDDLWVVLVVVGFVERQ